MTRIIAGFAGSHTLRVPRSGTRPTSDRVREAVFSALEARDAVDRAVVVDLYAGSGALGLEAASRGAARVVLVERSPAAAGVARRNAEAIAAAAPEEARPRIDVVASSVRSYLDRPPAQPAHLVFLDPPYELGEDDLAADLAALLPHLDDDAVVVVERSARTPEPRWPVGLAVERRKDYGETTVWWAAPQPATPSQPR